MIYNDIKLLHCTIPTTEKLKKIQRHRWDSNPIVRPLGGQWSGMYSVEVIIYFIWLRMVLRLFASYLNNFKRTCLFNYCESSRILALYTFLSPGTKLRPRSTLITADVVLSKCNKGLAKKASETSVSCRAIV